MLSSLTLQTNYNETYCNLYHRNGESLTNDDFGHIRAGNNLLTVLKNADIKDGYTYEQLEDDFENGRAGQISFDYGGYREDLCYIPVEGTNWVLTILIQDNVISSQISSISSGMMHRSIIQIIITMAAMIAVFAALI